MCWQDIFGAHMGGFGGHMGWGSFGWFWGIIVLVVLGFGIWGFVRYMVGPRTTSYKTPEDILRERYAKGEITQEEFDERMRGLRGERQ